MKSTWLRRSAAGLISAVALGTALPADEPSTKPVRVIGAPPAEVIVDGNVIVAVKEHPQAAKVAQGQFWIGAFCEPLEGALQAQLARDGGLVVESVRPDSPASKAGIAAHDVLLRFGEDELRSVEQLVELVEKHGGKEVDVLLLRGGKEKHVYLKPAERPKDQLHDIELVEKQMKDKLAQLRRHQAVTMSLVRPGVVLPPGHARSSDLPQGMSITIEKEGDSPAKIKVERGEESWSVTEDKLDTLPPEVRMHVEQFRGQTIHFRLPEGVDAERRMVYGYSHAVPATPGVPAGHVVVKPVPGSVPVPTATRTVIPFGHGDQSQQLAELSKKLDQVLAAVHGSRDVDALRQEVDALRSELKALREEAKK